MFFYILLLFFWIFYCCWWFCRRDLCRIEWIWLSLVRDWWRILVILMVIVLWMWWIRVEDLNWLYDFFIKISVWLWLFCCVMFMFCLYFFLIVVVVKLSFDVVVCGGVMVEEVDVEGVEEWWCGEIVDVVFYWWWFGWIIEVCNLGCCL